MSNTLFVNKYQPKKLVEFELSPTILDTLHTFLFADMLSLLLVGDFGTGKTSLLNAMVNEYYHGYSPTEIKRNTLYINNLKDQGINYYRTDVKTFCQTACTIKNKKKIIILDDIDLINDQCQQSFRNSLDKYSGNVHFIASCTNIQKVIDNIQSRLMIVKLPAHTPECLLHVMHSVCTAEEIPLDPGCETFLVDISNYSIKTMLNYLEKFKLLGGVIDTDTAMSLCTNIGFDTFVTYTQCIRTNDIGRSISILYQLIDSGYSVMDVLDGYFIFLKMSPIFTETEKYKIVPVICRYVTAFHNVHEDEIELALFTNNIHTILTASPVMA